MSLRGRYMIDRVKEWARRWNLSMPVPPYGKPEFWSKSYMSFTTNDPPIEWANLHYKEMQQYQYQLVDNLQQYLSFKKGGVAAKPPKSHGRVYASSTKDATQTPIPTTLVETLGLTEKSPEDDTNDDNDRKDPVLMLGCGNSKVAYEMWQSGLYRGPFVQVDVSNNIVNVMSDLHAEFIEAGDMYILQDDATKLAAVDGLNLGSNTTNAGTTTDQHGIAAVLDKGTIDALFCAECYVQCAAILNAVHRVLRTNGVYAFYSYSRPEFVLGKVSVDTRQWKSIQVRHDVTNGILLYRFEKAAPIIPVLNPSNKRKRSMGRG